MPVSRRVMFYVQTLLGVGHLARAAAIARAMADAGLDVTVVLGGEPVPGIDFAGCARVLLPPARVLDARFETIVDADGQPIDDTWRDRRTARLLFEFDAIRPHAVLIELFPFGRWPFRFELLPLIEAARTMRPRPRLISSVRDILVAKSDPRRHQAVIGLVQTCFDHVLVHGDPDVVGLDASFPATAAIVDKIVYTGYVVADRTTAPAPEDREDGRGEIVVSAGGGAVGEPLLRAALAARPLTKVADRPWRLITGLRIADPVFEALSWTRPPGVIVERWRTDLAVVLGNSMLSVSQAGYNTMMDLLISRTPAVVVPFADGAETEQTLRARVFAGLGAVTVVEADRLSPQVLAAAIDEALTKPRAYLPLNLTGAQTTARLIAEWCEAASGR
jgi:predicted glycosyltransferase